MQKIGDGTFGKAYKALNTISNEYVCVKIFKNCDEETRKTYIAEVRAGEEGMNHKNVLKLLAAGFGRLSEDGHVIC